LPVARQQSLLAAGTLTRVHDHHQAGLGKRLTKLQHDHTDLVVSTTHVHLTHDLCLEAIILRGSADRLQQIAAQLKGLKGIRKGELELWATAIGLYDGREFDRRLGIRSTIPCF
jgi:CopG family nickel-responsive transcriptional regulator